MEVRGYDNISVTVGYRLPERAYRQAVGLARVRRVRLSDVLRQATIVGLKLTAANGDNRQMEGAR